MKKHIHKCAYLAMIALYSLLYFDEKNNLKYTKTISIDEYKKQIDEIVTIAIDTQMFNLTNIQLHSLRKTLAIIPSRAKFTFGQYNRENHGTVPT